MWPVVFLLGLCTFVVGTAELVIAGVLPTVAADLGVTNAQAGYLVTAYALSFAIVTPVVATRTGQFPRRPMLLACLGIFVLGNAAATIAPNFSTLIGARIVTAAASGVFEVIATALAASLVPESQRGRAIAVVVGGFSVALLLGVPLGTLIGLTFGWRATFACLMALGVVIALGLAFRLPSITAETTERSWAILKVRQAWLALAATGLAFGGLYVVFTYIAVILEDIGHAPAQAVAALLLLNGAASFAGNVVGGATADRFGMRPTLFVATLGMATGLALVSLLAANPIGVFFGSGLVGLCAGVFVPTQQARLVSLAPRAPDLGLALNLSSLNVGIASGAAVGSALVDRGGLAILGYVGGALAVLAVILVAGEQSPT